MADRGDRGLLERLLAAPDDDAPREAYAERLRRRGDPRGEFIELQLRCARDRNDTAAWLAAEQLRRVHEAGWQPAIRGLRVSAWRRGFPECIFIGGADFLAGADAIFAQLPVRELALWHAEAELPRIAALPQLGHLRGLSLADEVGDPGFCALMASPHLGALEDLTASGNAIGPAGLRALAGAAWAAKLRRLELARNPVGDDGMAALAGGHFRVLADLGLHHCGITAAGAGHLARSPWLRTVTDLRLGENGIGSGLGVLAASEYAGALTILRLVGCEVDDDHARTFAATTRTGALVQLDLSHNFLHDAGAAALAGCGRLPQLVILDLSSNAIGEPGAEALAESPGLPALRSLGLSHNPIYVPGAVEDWQDWNGAVVGSGPVNADRSELQRRYGRRLTIT